MAKQPYGQTKTPFTLKSGNSIPFKMMGSSPMKQDVGIQTGFGPEADANLKKKINIKTGTSKPVVKKSVKKGLWKGAKKLVKKYFWPVTAIVNAPKLLKEDGIKKFAGSMLWDEDLFTTSIHSRLNPPKITKYNPDEKTTSNPKKIDWKNTKSSL